VGQGQAADDLATKTNLRDQAQAKLAEFDGQVRRVCAANDDVIRCIR